MATRDASCRELLGYGSAAAAGLAALRFPALAHALGRAFPGRPGVWLGGDRDGGQRVGRSTR